MKILKTLIKQKALKLSSTKDELEKLNLLLEILFPNPSDRIIYLKRYKTNYSLTQKETEQITSSLRDKLFYEVVAYDEENHYLVVHSHLNTLSVFPLFAAR